MAYTSTTEKMLPKLVALSPYEVYLNQVRSAIEPLRYLKLGLDYFPPQLGGLTGQRNVISEAVVLEMITFEVN
jgi:hypothetical protein